MRLVSALGLSEEGATADDGESGSSGAAGVEKGATGSLAGGEAKASGTGPCGFLQGEGGERGGPP